MIAGMTYYQICMYFLIYSFLGWVIEVVYHAVTLGKAVNRGFLNGPVCPVYGFGMLAVLSAGNAISSAASSAPSDVTKMNAPELFLFGMFLATAVELIAGWLLDKLFHARWWDYSDKPLNLNGYICPEFSIIWGLAIVLVVKVVHPTLSDGTVRTIPERYGWPVMGVLYLLYFADLVVTVLTVLKINRKLTELDHIRTVMRMPGNRLSKDVTAGTLKTARRIQEGQVQAALAKAEMKDHVDAVREERDLKRVMRKAELERRAEELRKELTSHSARRLLRAFPTLRHEKYDDLVRKLKESLDRPEKP